MEKYIRHTARKRGWETLSDDIDGVGIFKNYMYQFLEDVL